jgi:hypothetical protein
MSRFPATSFDTLRPWEGEQSRAFEELSFQLLKKRVPAGTLAIRTGNPDGGVDSQPAPAGDPPRASGASTYPD